MDFLIADKNLIKKDEESLYSEKKFYIYQKYGMLFLDPAELPSIDYSG